MKTRESISRLKGVGAVRRRQLESSGIVTIDDLLHYIPRRYDDYSTVKSIKDLCDGEGATVIGTVTGIRQFRAPNNPSLIVTKLIISDQTGSADVIWFIHKSAWRAAAAMRKRFAPGMRMSVSGRVYKEFGRATIREPLCQPLKDGKMLESGPIIPIYRQIQDISAKQLSSLIERAIGAYGDSVEEIVPGDIVEKYSLPSKLEALRKIHMPGSRDDIKAGFQRIAFEEMLLFQIGLGLRKKRMISCGSGIVHTKSDLFVRKAFSKLKFTPTAAQMRVISEIFRDMESDKPMYRLIQGDVGSGKTLVAGAALLKAAEGGYQGAMMVPTEVLAFQHYQSIRSICEGLPVNVALLKGQMAQGEKSEILVAVKNGDIDIIIGTHALIQDVVEFANLGLVITDEQHRFGVCQREALTNKGTSPDVLVMTATPIPRTLALSFFGDMDISVIDELPPGRKPVKTYWVPEGQKDKFFNFVKKEVRRGRQAYIVLPLIEQSDRLDMMSVLEEGKNLAETVFSEFRVGLLHGRMDSEAKREILESFGGGSLDILISTTVIEVGVDVSNATVMGIMDVQRFGLAQLHQLRGRVGRGPDQSYCFLVGDLPTEEAKCRVRVMTTTNDGFVIAEEDLRLRGPGEFFGLRQHGMPDLRIPNVFKYPRMMEAAGIEARRILEEDPGLESPHNKILLDELIYRFGESLGIGS